MKNELYNSYDEEYKNVIKLLNELPRESAPPNFEYNLSVRIKNRNFDLNSSEKKSLFPWRYFVPATGAVIASVFVFLVLFNDSDSLENPFQIQPKLRSEIKSDLFSSKKILGSIGNNQQINENDVVLKEDTKQTDKSIIEKEENLASNIGPKSELKDEVKADFPFNDNNSTNLDEALSERRLNTKIDRRASLAGRNAPSSFFNGFYIREEVDKEYVEAQKAKLDSLKKAIKMSRIKDKIAQ
ncbi:MAG: hypothetical protein H6610_03200 [Ignavibacteriales bacterium]|nr:hypothetical protein [Ignavibacteriales bacterium]MCB9218453.1 hypothetical protein [Ignavibacteriales bacterium]